MINQQFTLTHCKQTTVLGWWRITSCGWCDDILFS